MLIKKGFDRTVSKEEFLDFRKDVESFKSYVDKRFEQVDRQIGVLTETLNKFIKATNDNFLRVYARLDRIHDDISDLPAMREELRTLRTRVERLERKAAAAK